jgi:cysteine peptidase C11 family protein
MAHNVGTGVIEVDRVDINGCRAMRTIFKAQQQPTGLTYIGALTFPFRDFSFLKIGCHGVAVMSPKTPKAWTLLAYAVADDKGASSPLDQAAQREVKALCDAADLDQMNVALQLDMKRPSGVFRAVLRTHLRPHFLNVAPEKYDFWREVVQKVEDSDLVLQREQTDLNSATSDVLRDFLSYGRKECPAKRYAIFFYGHAFGPMGLFYDQARGERVPRTLRLTDLESGLHAKDGPADVVLFRDCFVDNLETAYQLRRVARFMIATQAEAPIAGEWPWDSILSTLMASADSSDVATALEKQLAAHFRQKENRGRLADVPVSLLDIDATQEAVGPLKALVQALDASRDDAARCRACADALERARLGSPVTPTRPGDAALLDVPTMCDNLQAIGDPIASIARALNDSVKNRIVKTQHSQKGRFGGISIYYKPVTERDRARSFIQASAEADIVADDTYYKSLALSRATGWHRVALRPLGT